MDMSKLSESDLRQIAKGDLRMVSEEGLRMLAGAQYDQTPKALNQEKGFGQQLSEGLSGIPRQIGLTARHGLEGVGSTLDMLASPIRAGMNAILPNDAQITGNTGKAIADKIGLPTPQTKTERIAEVPTQLMAGGMSLVKGAQLLSRVPGMAGEIAGLLSENPAMQLQSAAGAGTASGYVKETGGGPMAQGTAALAGGLAVPLGIDAVKAIPRATKGVVEFLAPGVASANQIPQQVDITISRLLEQNGLKIGDLTASVRNQLREDVTQALKTGGNLDDAALRRLADYRMVGATPRRSTLTLDPADVSREKNAAKFGINSADPKLQQLGQIENANNRTLIEGLNNIGANQGGDSIGAASKVMGRLSSLNNSAKSSIDEAYAAARATGGRSAALDPYAFTQKANNLLDDALLGGQLPPDVRNLLNKAATGEMPLTVDVAEQLKTRIGDLQRSSNEASVRKSLGLVRQALEDTPLLEGQGQAAIDAFNKARGMNRQWMSIVDRVPALQAVRDGVEPDKFVQDFIIGNGSKASVMDTAKLKTLIKDSPDAMTAVRGQMLGFLKGRALNGAADEVGNFSQSAYNKALQSIGERKLRLFFDKSEIEQIKAIGRVASYEQVQPRGSAVNNSNTAGAAMATIFDKLASSPLVGKIPMAPQIAGNVSASLTARRALNAPSAVVIPEERQFATPFLLPAFAGSGLLTN